jgi:hypothetical protein
MDSIAQNVFSYIDQLKERFNSASQTDKKKWIAYGALLLISLALFVSLGGSKRKYPDAATPDEGATNAEMFGNMSEELTRLGGVDLSYAGDAITMEDINPVHSTWGRDPFTPLLGDQEIPRKTGDDNLSLSAISWKGGEAVVLINDFVLREGESADGVEVVEIHPSSVVLKQDGERITLRLREGS